MTQPSDPHSVLSTPGGDRAAPGGFKVDPSRGARLGRAACEWATRPDDQRYLSLGALHQAVRRRADQTTGRLVDSQALRVDLPVHDDDDLRLLAPGEAGPLNPTHWAFGQLSQLAGAPAGYLRQLPARLAAINLQHGLQNRRSAPVQILATSAGPAKLRAATSAGYGRIWDHELVEAVMKIAGDGVGDTCWKAPGVLDWSTMTHNPFIDITRETTTLYASDRDVFIFLVDDTHPIEAGRLPNGAPDLYFRGFYCWNSEVGGKSLGMASFYLRAVCLNRNIWGAEGFEEIVIRHSKHAAQRFIQLAAPALEAFATASPAPFIAGVRAAREAIVARQDDERDAFLRRRGFSASETQKIIVAVWREEDRPPETVFDFVQGVTAVARAKPHQDVRLDWEARAAKLLSAAV